MDKITHHEDGNRQDYQDFIQGVARQLGVSIPAIDNAKGVVTARVNHGRWIVDCPNTSCRSAVVASQTVKLYICPECGSPENGGNWYVVKFPTNKVSIEAELLKRNRLNRNWEPRETLADIRAENRREGVDK